MVFRRMKKYLLLFIVAGLLFFLFFTSKQKRFPVFQNTVNNTTPTAETFPLQIEEMRKKNYSGSDIQIEEQLGNGSNYKQYVVSYKSDGLKIYALLTVPLTEMPKGGYPAIIFNHGYIPPEQYVTTEKYVAYVDGFARNGYIVFKPDYRGHGRSEGKPEGAYYSPAYTTDVLNALSSVKKLKEVNPQKIGMWGHSLGGNITMRAMVVSRDIKAGVIWDGVVGTYDDLLNRWVRAVLFRPSTSEAQAHVTSIRRQLTEKYGTPKDNPTFWNTIDPHAYLKDVSGPVELHHSAQDDEVPLSFSQSLYDDLKKAGKTVELFTYEGTDHNLSQGFDLAMQRSVAFFDKYLKQ